MRALRPGEGEVPYNELIQHIYRANTGILTLHFVPRGTVADVAWFLVFACRVVVVPLHRVHCFQFG